MHDVTAARTEGIEDLLRQYPDVTAAVDSGYQAWPVTSPPSQRPTEETGQGRHARANRQLGTTTPPAVLGTDQR
jgi:hypothetical protein